MKMNLKQAAFVVALVALAASGLIINTSTATADEFRAKPGDTVEVQDGDVIVVDAPTSKTKVKLGGARHSEPAPVPVLADDDFSQSAAVAEPEDPTATAEVALRALLTPTGPQLGGAIGFNYRPANRWRISLAANAGKGLLDLDGKENELVALGFTAGVSKLLTRTVEIGAFGTVGWSYRDLTHEVSTSFLALGPGFRINKMAGSVFFEAGLPIGISKKFETGSWNWTTGLSAAVGFHF